MIVTTEAGLAVAGAWVKDKGELYLSPGFYYLQTDHYFDEKGTRRPAGCLFKKEELYINGEYGVSISNTITFRTAYDSLECGKDKVSGLSDIELGSIHNLKKGNTDSLSASGILILPSGYSLRDHPLPGYGRIGIQGSLLYGRGFRRGFIDISGGVRHYFGYPSDQIRFYCLLGLDILPMIQMLPFFDAQIGLGNGEKMDLGQDIQFEADYKLMQTGATIKLRVSNTMSVTGGVTLPVYVRNSGGGLQYNAGILYSF